MPLSPGARIGVFEIVAPLGQGGMGEVYRATDTNLGRQVAIKILPPEFAADAERVARFEREARTLASLNHPNIAQVYGLEPVEREASAERSGKALVMELVEGEDLSEKIRSGTGNGGPGTGLPLDEALPIARQIAEALEAAHDAGIIHRDLKPANIKVRPDGTVKVLDFGLAKAIETGTGNGEPGTATMSPTITTPAMTMRGVILGTAAYMSPEQAKGKLVDRRTDIWAFGCVLYEMLTGARPFKGEDISDIMVAILRDEPALNALPPDTPPFVQTLIARCLQKDPRKRLPHIGLVRVELDSPQSTAAAPPPPAPHARPLFWRVLAAVAVAAIAGVAGAVAASLWRPAPPPAPVTRFSFSLPEGQSFTTNNRKMVDVSPDGARIVYVANRQLYVRRLDEPEPRLISVTLRTGILDPVFSPDSAWIAFESDNKIMRVPIEGGTPLTVCACGPANGLSWHETGIVTATRDGIVRVLPEGGTPEVLVQSNPKQLFFGPQMLPGAQHLLYTVADMTGSAPDVESARVVVHRIGDADPRSLANGSGARYLNSGHLLYATGGMTAVGGLDGSIVAAPFDLKTQSIAGAAVSVSDARRITGSAPFASHLGVSSTGTLAYVPGGSTEQDIAVLDRSGRITSLLQLPPSTYMTPRVSPDGSRVAYTGRTGNTDIYIASLTGASAPRRLTYSGRNFFPVWSPDGRRIAFQSDREGDLGIFWQPVDGSGEAERLTRAESGSAHAPEAYSPDGQHLLFRATSGDQSRLWLWSRATRAVQALNTAPLGREPYASFSSDGRWIAYTASDRGRRIFVEPFPATGARYQLPIPERGADLTIHPVWGPVRPEIVYSVGPGLLATTSVAAGSAVEFGVPSVTQVPGAGDATHRSWDLTPDGRSIVRVVETVGGLALQPPINVVVNWFQELRSRVPRP